MRGRLEWAGLLMVTMVAAVQGTAALEPLPSRSAVHASLAAGARAAIHSLRAAAEGGLVAKCDYHLIRGVWYDYERLWHTAQTIEALVRTSSVLAGANRTSLLAAATAAGQWWSLQKITEPPSLAGVMNSSDVLPAELGCITDACDGAQDLTDVSDGAYGIFALSAAIGNSHLADLATASALWQLEHMAVANQPGLYWNVLNKTADPPAPITNGPKPFRSQIEGSLFLQAYQHSRDTRLLNGFMAQADTTVRFQDEHGLWMRWTPNDNSTGYLHPRYNLWYAFSLVDAYEVTQNRSYALAALRTATFYVNHVQRRDGTIYYKSNLNGTAIENDLCGSAVGLLLSLLLRLLRASAVLASQPPATAEKLLQAVKRCVSWLLANQYPWDHPDVNLAGAFLEIDFRHEATYLGPHSRAVVHRDLGTSFALPALVEYCKLCDEQNTNAIGACASGWFSGIAKSKQRL